MARPGEGHFDMGEDGGIKAAPLMDWSCAPLADLFVLVRLRYARTRAELSAGGTTTQLTMSPQQALQLADALRTRAELVLRQNPAGPVN